VPVLTGLWAYTHVADVERSIAFYRHLGLEPRDTHVEGGTLVWAFVTSSPDPDQAWARLMLARADEPVDRERQGVLFYCWTPDVRALHARLRSAGVDASEIEHPFYMPAGEFHLTDPDGYLVVIGQLGERVAQG
jgi:catechol 2,3-dioxygenase-like lactoylglutathione lyase family enzyme